MQIGDYDRVARTNGCGARWILSNPFSVQARDVELLI